MMGPRGEGVGREARVMLTAKSDVRAMLQRRQQTRNEQAIGVVAESVAKGVEVERCGGFTWDRRIQRQCASLEVAASHFPRFSDWLWLMLEWPTLLHVRHRCGRPQAQGVAQRPSLKFRQISPPGAGGFPKKLR